MVCSSVALIDPLFLSVVILGEDLNWIETFSIPYNYVTTEYICMIFGDNIYGYHIYDNRQFDPVPKTHPQFFIFCSEFQRASFAATHYSLVC